MRPVLLLLSMLLLASCGADKDTDKDSDEAASNENTVPAARSAAMERGARLHHVNVAQSAEPEGAVPESAVPEEAITGVRGPIRVGDPKAPVLIEEYASMTCPACAGFHTLVYPQVKEQLIDTGRARFEFNNYILGGRLDLGASLAARCSTPTVAEKFTGVLFQRQQQWGRTQDAVAELASLARIFGINRVQFDQCMQNQGLARHLIEMTKQANERGVTATPTLYVNGTMLDNYGFDSILQAVEAAESE